VNSTPVVKIQNKLSEQSWNLVWVLIAFVTFSIFAHRAWFIEATDFVAYYNAGSRILHSTPLYLIDEPTPFKYLPFSAYFFAPLSLLPFKLAKMLFFAVSFLASVLVYKRAITYYGHAVAILLFASFIRFHNYDFLNSQVNQILLWFLMNWIWDRNIKPNHSALSFALLCTFKVTPLIMLFPLILLKNFREAFRIAGFFVLLCLIPLFHIKGGLSIYQEWYNHMRGTTPSPVPDWDILQSIPVALWFWVKNSISQELFRILCLTLSISLMAWSGKSVFHYTRNLKRFPSRLVLVENAILSGFFILTIVLSPLAWKHNYLLLFPAILSLIIFSQTWIYGAQFLMLTLVPATLGNLFPELVHRSYIMVWGALVVFFGLTRIARTQFKQKVQVWLYSKNKEIEFLTLQTNERRGKFWQPVTGSVEPGETSAQSAVREAKEETGFQIENTLKLIPSDFVFNNQLLSFYEFVFFSEIDLSQKSYVKIDPKEHSQFEWLAFSKAIELVKFDSNKNILKKIFLLLQRH
jgi:8-oxo-dGTP pyrophosphatase MutT (NUDIX family)